MIGTPAKPNDPKVGRVLGRRQGQEGLPVHARHQGEPRELPHFEDARNGGQRAFPSDRKRSSKGSGQRQDPELSRAQGPDALSSESAAFLPGRPALANDRQPRASNASDGGLVEGPARSGDGGHCGDEARRAGNDGGRAAQGRASRARTLRFATSAPRRLRISTTLPAWMSWARRSCRSRNSGRTRWRLWRRSISRRPT